MTSCKNIFRELEILTVRSLIILECCLSVKRNLTIDDLVVKKHNYGTREKNKFMVAVKDEDLETTQSRRVSFQEEDPAWKNTTDRILDRMAKLRREIREVKQTTSEQFSRHGIKTPHYHKERTKKRGRSKN